MTYREYVLQHNPKREQPNLKGGMQGCPGHLDSNLPAPTCGPTGSFCDENCEDCWNREMPVKKPTKKLTPRKGLSGKIVYIAGPITGVEEYWKAFEAAEEELTGQGYIVLTPSRLPKGLTNAQAMRTCLAMIDTADWVYFLPGSQESRGARLELDYCLYIGKPYQWSEGGGQG